MAAPEFFPTFLQAELRREVGLRLAGLLQGFQENRDVPVQEALERADGASYQRWTLAPVGGVALSGAVVASREQGPAPTAIKSKQVRLTSRSTPPPQSDLKRK